MSENPYVSILVTTFNHENYIGKCLDSILKQERNFKIEILVLDDASTDRTQEVILDYVEKFPKVIKPFLQVNNLYSCLQKGLPILLENARGKYIAICDGDDFWIDPSKLVKQTQFLEQNPSFFLTFHDTVNVDDNGLIISKPFAPHNGKFEFSKEEFKVRKSNWLYLGTLIFRNIPIKFPPEYNLIPNGDNFIPMLLSDFGYVKYLSEIGPLAHRHHSTSSYTSKNGEEKSRMHVQTYLQIASYYIRIKDLNTAQKIVAHHLLPRLIKYLNINIKKN